MGGEGLVPGPNPKALEAALRRVSPADPSGFKFSLGTSGGGSTRNKGNRSSGRKLNIDALPRNQIVNALLET